MKMKTSLFEAEPTKLGIEKRAVISRCGLYRYSLTRLWDENKPGALFIMLNPSTADADKDDPTIRRCVGFAKAWGCGSMTVVNLFAYRATKPEALIAWAKWWPYTVIGPDNDDHIRRCIDDHSERGDFIVTAWGTHGSNPALRYRTKEVVQYLPLAELLCLSTTKNGDPRHPLYCRADAVLTNWEEKR